MAEVPEYVLDAAREVFRSTGYERATVREIAAAAGIGVSSLYSHIGSKEELFLSIVMPEIDAVSAEVALIASSDLEPREKLRSAIVTATTAFDKNYPELFIYLRDFFPTLESSDPQRAWRYEQSWYQLIEDGARRGIFRNDLDPKILTKGILGMVSWLYRWYRQGGQYSASEIGEQLADMVIGGLLAPAPAKGAGPVD
jgi:AcrR family transcriptional regulator